MLAYGDGGNGNSGCAPEDELVSCSAGNAAGISGRLCTAPEQNQYVDYDSDGQASPTARENSTVSYSNANPNDRSTREHGAPGCWRSEWDEGQGWLGVYTHDWSTAQGNGSRDREAPPPGSNSY